MCMTGFDVLTNEELRKSSREAFEATDLDD